MPIHMSLFVCIATHTPEVCIRSHMCTRRLACTEKPASFPCTGKYTCISTNTAARRARQGEPTGQGRAARGAGNARLGPPAVGRGRGAATGSRRADGAGARARARLKRGGPPPWTERRGHRHWCRGKRFAATPSQPPSARRPQSGQRCEACGERAQPTCGRLKVGGGRGEAGRVGQYRMDPLDLQGKADFGAIQQRRPSPRDVGP